MRFVEMLDQEIEAQERILEAHPAYIRLKALRAARDAYVGSDVDDRTKSKSEPLPSKYEPLGYEYIRPQKTSPAGGKSLAALNEVVAILSERGQPLRTVELLYELQQRGIVFDGAAPQNILSSILSRSTDVVSKGGHIGWALMKWDSAESTKLPGNALSADVQPGAEGREAGPGGGT